MEDQIPSIESRGWSGILTFDQVFGGRALVVDAEAAGRVALGGEEGLAGAHENVRRVIGEVALRRRLNGVGPLEGTPLVFQICGKG